MQDHGLILAVGIYALALALAKILSDHIYELQAAGLLKVSGVGLWSAVDVRPWIEYAVFIFLIVILLLRLLQQREFSPNKNELIPITKKQLLIFAGGLFLAWLPGLLIFFPGTGMNDTVAIIKYLGTMVQHPFFYVAFINGLGRVSNFFWYTKVYGIFFASLIQMLLMAVSLAGVSLWVYKKTGKKYVLGLLFAYFAFLPLIGNYAIAVVKDTLFSVGLFLWIPLLYEVFVNHLELQSRAFSRRYFWLISFWLLTTRNNGPYIWVVLMLILLLKSGKARSFILKSGIILFIICSLPNFYLQVFRNKPQLFQEKVGVQLQQLCRAVAVKGNVSSSSRAYISKVLPLEAIPQQYSPFTVDLIKWGPGFQRAYFQTHQKEFWSAWLETGKSNPRIYVEAWLLQTYGYWGLLTPSWGYQSKFGCALAEAVLQGQGPGDDEINYRLQVGSLPLPVRFKEAVGNWLYRHSDYLPAGICFWLVGFLSLLYAAKGQYRALAVFLPVLLCWGTLMISAPFSFAYRYLFVYPLCLPVFVILAFVPPPVSHPQKYFSSPLYKNKK